MWGVKESQLICRGGPFAFRGICQRALEDAPETWGKSVSCRRCGKQSRTNNKMGRPNTKIPLGREPAGNSRG